MEKIADKVSMLGGKYVCPHNNLTITRPDLMREWHPANILNPQTLLSQSGKKVWWICSTNPCGCHVWEAVVQCRTKDVLFVFLDERASITIWHCSVHR